MTNLKKDIIDKLAEYGQQGSSVNELFRNLRCNRNDFIQVKRQLIKQGIISTEKEGKQKTRLILNSQFFSELDSSFMYRLKSYSTVADDAIKQLRNLRPLFRRADDDILLKIKPTHTNVAGLLSVISGVLDSISHYIMVFTLRYHIDPQAKRFDLKENQKHGFKTIQIIIEKLIKQHKDEEQEIRNYLLWGGTSSSFSYVF
ncbi:MAG: hypothetical protein ACREA3_02150 [Nitrosotalea sp.]